MGAGSYGQTLKRQGLQSFLWTQFLGAFNDNVCKIRHLDGGGRGRRSGGGRNCPLVGVVFILPFLLFSGYAGQLADRYSKRTVLIVTKALEIVAMILAVIAFSAARFDWMLAVLFLIALQATFFSPAKYGIVPEILPDRELSRANGLLEMSTFVAIVLGTAIGGFMFAAWKDSLTTIGLALLVIAVVGSLTSLGIPHGAAHRARAPPAPATRRGLHPAESVRRPRPRLEAPRRGSRAVAHRARHLLLLVPRRAAADACSCSSDRRRWASTRCAPASSRRSWPAASALGSLVAGRLSGDKVELGLVPLGSIGMGVFALILPVDRSVVLGPPARASRLLGFSGGLFAVPLNALLQQRPGRARKGPAARDQQLPQHRSASCSRPARCGCSTRGSDWPPNRSSSGSACSRWS